MIAVPSLVSPLAAQVPDATVPRLRIVRQVRFAAGELVALNGALVLGRAPVAPERAPTAQTLVVPDSSFMISSTHCWLSLEDGEVWVEDLGSTNGTDVVSPSGTTELGGGQRMVLTSADRVQLGDNWCQLEPSPQVLT